MKILLSNLKIWFCILAALLCCASLVDAQTDSRQKVFDVTRFTVAESVVDREPVGESRKFPADIETVYCFLEARNITSPTDIVMVWSFEGSEVSRVSLSLGQSPRWRTFSSKKIGNKHGEWSVKVMGSGGEPYATLNFTVE